MRTETTELSLKKITIFWLPLAGTWLMMSFEGPFIAAIIARLAEPKFNLAAYGVAFAIGLIVEAPIIMIMSAATSLVRDRLSFYKLRKFTYTLNFLITMIMLVILVPPVFNFLTRDLIGLQAEVSELTYGATALLLPWPAAIGYRRFYQGILIRQHATRRVAYGTVIRLLAMSTCASLLYVFGEWPGVYVGTAALSCGVLAEAITTRFMVHPFLARLSAPGSPEVIPLSYRTIIKFYYPLALTSMLTLGVHPIVTFFIGHSPQSLESLAVLPVINSLVFIFRGLGLSFQEVGIALMGDKLEHYYPIRRFAGILALSLAAGLTLIAFTPLGELWFRVVSGLSEELTTFARTPLMILALFPASSVWISLQRSILVNAGDTVPVTVATAIEVVIIVAVLSLCIHGLEWVGVIAAACAYFAGRVGANLFLYPATHKHVVARGPERTIS